MNFEHLDLRRYPLVNQAAMGAVLTGIIAGIGWISLQHFIELQDSQGRFQATLDLERQVADLQHQYQEANPEALEQDLRNVGRYLVGNFTQLTQWAESLQTKSRMLGLQTQYHIVKTEKTASPVEGVTMIPLKILVSAKGTKSGYQNFINFLKEIEKTGPRVDIQDITIIGDGEQATQLDIGLQVWMKATDSVEL